MSKPITITIPHQLGAAEARRRLETGLAQLASQIPGGDAARFTQSWTGDVLNFSALAMGQAITGAVNVLDDHVRLDVVLPGMLGMIAGKIKGELQKRGQLLLEKK
jgi:putative polyhydroxyalkanoate system protein